MPDAAAAPSAAPPGPGHAARPAIVHVTCEHAADDARITARELATLLDRHGEAWIVARPPRGALDPRLHFVEAPPYERATKPHLAWPALDAAVRSTPEPRLIHAHEPETAIAAARFGWCPPERLVHDVHEYHGAMMAHRATGLRRAVLRRLGDRRHRRACRLAGAVVAVNDELAASARAAGATDVEVLTNAPTLTWAGTADTAHDPARIVYVGGVSAPRGVATMVEAFDRVRREHPGAVLEVVGPVLDETARAALAGPPAGVVVTGPLPPAEARARMAAASIGLVPFDRVVHFRGRPVKLLEYALAGLSIVTTTTGPKEAFVHETRCGAVVPPGDPDALAAACAARLADPDHAREEGARARAAALELAWERAEAPRLLALYDRLLGEAPAPTGTTGAGAHA